MRSDQLVAVGDSVMLASAPALTAAFPGIAVDAKVARQAPATLGDATQWLQQEPNRQVVILHTGTNGTVRADDLSRFLDAAGPDRRIVLVNIHAERSWTQADNALLEKVAAEHTNVAIADWSGRISGHPDMLAADGIHPNKRGQQEYVAAVRDALAQLEVTVEAP